MRNHVERDRDQNKNERRFASFHTEDEFWHGSAAGEMRFKGMDSSTEDKAKGAAKEAIGTVKEKTGEVIGNPDLQDRGTVEKVEGKVQQKVGDVKKVFEQ